MPDVQFDTYYRYDDLTRILHGYAAEYPHLLRVESIGQSFEGRDIWLATVTNFETGEHAHKPALWVDGNIHATEVSPSTACLYLAWTPAPFTSAPASTPMAPSGPWRMSPKSSAPARVPIPMTRTPSGVWYRGTSTATGVC
jgi:hypothetical protein